MLGKLKEPLEKVAPKDFKRKFSAWWEGEDYVPLDGAPSVPDEEPVPEQKAPEKPVNVADEVLTMAVAQGVWGAGYLCPGTPEYYIEMAKTLSLSKEKSMAVLNAGLCGPSRDISKFSDIWITAYENLPAAAAEAERQNMMAGMAKKVEVKPFDPNTVTLPEKKFNAIVSFERFCFVKEKQRLLQQAEASLRPGGYLLVCDYVTTDEELDQDTQDLMFARQSETADLWTMQTYVDAIGDAGLGIRVQEDITQDHIEMIQHGANHWAKLMTELESEDASLQAKIYGAVGDEQAQWVKRLEALQAGKLAVYRFLALKPSAPVH